MRPVTRKWSKYNYNQKLGGKRGSVKQARDEKGSDENDLIIMQLCNCVIM